MVLIQPDLTFRDNKSPYGILATLSYVQSAPGGDNFPVLQGQNSDPVVLRIYNNFARNAGLATALDIQITTFDGTPAASHTALNSTVNQEWLRIYETGYGENSTSPGLYTQFTGTDTPVGGSDTYRPERGSSGVAGSFIRAGTNNNGMGFIEIATYVQLPQSVAAQSWPFAISVIYDWNP